MFLALIFSLQVFAAEPVTVPGLTMKTLVLKAGSIPGFCPAMIKPELRMVEGRPSLIIDDVRFRFSWHQVSTPEEVVEIEQTQSSSTMTLVNSMERITLKLKDGVVDLTINSGTKDKNGIFHVQDPQPLRCLWAAK